MNTIKLNNNVEIPQIGVGTWTLRGETARWNVRQALEAGFRHIDTVQGYENETEVGQGIADSGVARQEIFVTTKVNTSIMRQGKQAVIDSIDESLCKLNMDYIDLLLIGHRGRGMGTVRTGRHRCCRSSAVAVACSEIRKDRLANRPPLDSAARTDYHP